MNLLDEKLEEARELTAAGFEAAWVRDLVVGDIFAGLRLFSHDGPRKLFVVERIFKSDASYWDEEDDKMHENVVVNMIVTDENEIQQHLSYGHTHGIYIWRPDV